MGLTENLASQRIDLLLRQLAPALVCGFGAPAPNELTILLRITNIQPT